MNWLNAILVALCFCQTYGTRADFSLIWYEHNSTETKIYQAKGEISESLQNARRIEIKHKITILRDLDVSFAKHLETLIVEDCGINDIVPGSFKNVPAIKNLSVIENDFRTIKEGVFNNLPVQFLNLSHNRIQVIDSEAFDNMKNLTTIILDHNELASYKIDFLNCPSLAKISYRYNFVKILPECTFKNLKEQKLIIDFSYNKIRSIEKEALFDVKEFKDVLLHHNELQDATVLLRLSKADKVDMHENKIECLPKEFMENGLSKIKLLNITHNPLNCSCLNDLKKKVKKNIEFQKMSPLVKNAQIVLPEKDCQKP